MESKKINQLATNVAPQTSDLTIIGDPITGVSKKITLLQIADLFATTGTVTSVAVTETGDALTISGSPITTAGTINIGFAGGANQYVRGDGALADFPTSTGGGSSVSYYLNSSVSQGTIGGVAYRELSKDPISGAGTDITISSNGYVASYITDANDPSLLEVPGGNFNCEFYFSVNSNAHNPYVYAELYKYDGTTFTLLGSSQSVPEYLTNGTTLSPYYFAIPVATAALTITDRLAIRIYVNVDTRVVTLHTENNHLCQVVTTFSKGLTSLNNLTRQVQFLATGTSGTDFNISSSTATHTFNLPVASATNTGKLSSTDWSTFNGKQAALSFTAPLINTSNTISIPVATASVDGYLDNADWTIFNNKQNAITLTTTGTSGAATLVGSTLNIPNYAPDLSGYVTLTTTQTITGTKVLQNGAVLPSTGGTNQISVFINTFNIEEASGTTNRFGFNDSNNIYFNKGVLGGGGINGGLISFNNTASRTYTLQNASGTLAFTSDLSAYLPLAGGTLTGALNGTSAVFSSTVQASAYRLTGMTAGAGALYWSSDRVTLANYNASGTVTIETGGGTTALTLAANQAATFISSVTAASFVSTNGNNSTAFNSASATTGWVQIAMNNTSGSSLLGVEGSTAGTLATGSLAYASVLRNYTNTALQIATNNIVRLTIASNGAATFSSSVTATTGLTVGSLGSGSDAIISLATNASGSPRTIYYKASNATLNFTGTGGTDLMTLTNGGALLISQTTDNGDGKLQITTTGGNAIKVRQSSAGGYALDVNAANNGGTYYYQNFNANTTGVGSITSNGSSTSYNTSSDYRLKEDLKEIKGLEKLSAIKVYDFKWKHNEFRMDGVLAHELQEVLPYAVTGQKDNIEMQSVDYSKIVPILVKAIQELKAELEILKNK